MRGLILIGGGGHCRAAIDVIEAEGKYCIRGVVERPDATHDNVIGYPVIGYDQNLQELLAFGDRALVTIGQIKTPHPRRRAFEKASRHGACFPRVVSPRSHVSTHACIGDGSIVMHSAVVNACAQVGRNCIINTLSLVEHDVQIGDHCHIATGARVNGDASVGEGCFIGSGAILTNGVVIGEGSVIGAGCVIRHDIAPASVIRTSYEGPRK